MPPTSDNPPVKIFIKIDWISIHEMISVHYWLYQRLTRKQASSCTLLATRCSLFKGRIILFFLGGRGIFSKSPLQYRVPKFIFFSVLIFTSIWIWTIWRKVVVYWKTAFFISLKVKQWTTRLSPYFCNTSQHSPTWSWGRQQDWWHVGQWGHVAITWEWHRSRVTANTTGRFMTDCNTPVSYLVLQMLIIIGRFFIQEIIMQWYRYQYSQVLEFEQYGGRSLSTGKQHFSSAYKKMV